MNEAESKQHLRNMLSSFTAGSVLHLLAQVVRDSEKARLGILDDIVEERIREAEAFLWLADYGVDAGLPRERFTLLETLK